MKRLYQHVPREGEYERADFFCFILKKNQNMCNMHFELKGAYALKCQNITRDTTPQLQ
jgi:hypothetical protein